MGGVLVILPVAITIFVLNWLFRLVMRLLRPLTDWLIRLIPETFPVSTHLLEYILPLLSIVVIIILAFFLGLLVRTGAGNALISWLDDILLSRIPFYSLIRDTVNSLIGTKQAPFSRVALVDVYGNATRMTGFITNENEVHGYFTVFVPTGPNPTSGNIFHVKEEQLEFLDIGVDDAMRTIISCGTGASDLFESSQKKLS